MFLDLRPAVPVFIFGACIGSFLNVCIHRIPLGKSIVSPGSACPACGCRIPPYLNIPVVSYLILRGKCQSCGNPISIRYPLVELLTGIMALASLAFFGPTLQALYWFAFLATLITVTFIDIDHQIIPDVISLPGVVVFALSFLIVPGRSFIDTALGILFGGGILYSVALVYYLVRREEGMGGGDIKLLAMIGAAVGWKGVFFTLFAASLAGTLAGIVVMAINRAANIRLRIPFGPYLSLGAALYLFFGDTLTTWYFGLLR